MALKTRLPWKAIATMAVQIVAVVAVVATVLVLAAH